MNDMKIKAIAPWYGSKRTLAETIVRQLGKHRAYWDLCCGSLAVPFQKAKCEHEYLVDLHGDLINLVSVLCSDRAADLYYRLSSVVISEHIFAEAKDTINEQRCVVPASTSTVHDRHVTRAYWYMIFSWAGMSGFGGTKNKISFATRYTTGGGPQSARFRNAVQSIPVWHERLRNTNPLQRSIHDVIPKIADQSDVAIYFDPPYLDKSEAYVHDFTIEDHHKAAEALCEKTKCRIVVSYYDDERLSQLYPGWTKINCTMKKQLSLANNRGAQQGVAPEVLLINGDPIEESGLLF